MTYGTLEINFTGYSSIEITDYHIKEIVEEYRGNYEQYFEEIDVDRYEVEWGVEKGRYFDKNLIEKALEQYRIENGLNDDYFLPYKKTEENFLKECKISKNDFKKLDLNEISLDRDTLSLATKTADYNNPKLELNCIYFDDENIVATDTKKLIIIKNNSKIKNKHIPKFFCKKYIEDETAKLYIKDDDVVLESKDGYFYHNVLKNWNFPLYKRIIPKCTHTMSSKEFYKKIKVFEKNEAKNIPDLAVFQISKDDFLSLNNKFLLREYDFDKFSYTDNFNPVMFFNEKIKYIIMPFCLYEENNRQQVDEIREKFKKREIKEQK